MSKGTAYGVYQRLRIWLLSGSLGAVAVLSPVAAHAQEHSHHKRVQHHVTHGREHHVDHERAHPVAYRHEERSSHRLHVTNADYRPEQRVSAYHREHDAHLIRADYRPEHRRYHSHERIYAHFAYSRLQCVPYAREVSHIELSGDAFLWWAEAAGRYERGYMPAVGSVLNFRSTGRMPLGHVAVVTAVLNQRTILVTQANWVRGTITNDVTVEDISADNNWSDVRVEYGNGSEMGSSYPTYGFIYNRPASTPTIYAANAGGRNEVAEAPMARAISTEAPNRSLR